jgi:hypothetical protein
VQRRRRQYTLPRGVCNCVTDIHDSRQRRLGGTVVERDRFGGQILSAPNLNRIGSGLVLERERLTVRRCR